MAEATLIEIPDITGGALKSWATKRGLDFDEVKAAKAAGQTQIEAADVEPDDDEDAPPAAVPSAKKSDELSREYTFRVIPTHRSAGRNLNLRITAPDVVTRNGNSQFIRFKRYVFSTKSRGIRDYLRAGIKSGDFPFLFEDVQVSMRCTVEDCGFITTATGPAGLAELNKHFMAAHAGTVDEDGDED